MIELRPHQQDCVNACKQNSFGTITDTCGAGKSYSECALIYDAFQEAGDKSCVVCYGAHRLDLIDQQYHSLCKYFDGRMDMNDVVILEVSSADRSDINSTTNIDGIMKAIESARKNNHKLLIYFCYASAGKLYNAFRKSIMNTDSNIEHKADMIICDEAHFGKMSINESTEAFNTHMFRDVTNRMYFFTATPTTLTLQHNGVTTMPIIHEYNYGQALQDNIVLPFTIHWMTEGCRYDSQIFN